MFNYISYHAIKRQTDTLKEGQQTESNQYSLKNKKTKQQILVEWLYLPSLQTIIELYNFSNKSDLCRKPQVPRASFLP